MAKWILKCANQLVEEEESQNSITPTQAKVKVSHALLTDYDTLIYCGKIPVEYPRVLGRAAVGIVTEVGENCYGIERGMRVFLKPTVRCGECLACKNGKKRDCTSVQIAGKDFDGGLRDFLTCEYNNMAVLPSSVDEFRALCIEYVGMAENIYDKLNLSAGQRVAVIGAGFIGNVIAQVLIYHKVIPIVVDNDATGLMQAKSSGAYFTYPADEDLCDRVFAVTCGNMCDAVVYCGDCNVPINTALELAGDYKTVVLCSQSDLNANIDANVVLSKNLTIKSVSHAYTYTDAVINMLINNAVNFDVFEHEVLTDFDLPKLFAERAKNLAASKKNRITILKMII